MGDKKSKDMSMTDVRKCVRCAVAEMKTVVKMKGLPAVVIDNHIMAGLHARIIFEDTGLLLTVLEDPTDASAAVCIGGRGEHLFHKRDVDVTRALLHARYGESVEFTAEDEQWVLVKHAKRNRILTAVSIVDSVLELLSILDENEQLIPGSGSGAWAAFMNAWADGKTEHSENLSDDEYVDFWGKANRCFKSSDATELFDNGLRYTNAWDGIRFALDKGVPVFRMEKIDEYNYRVTVSNWYLYMSGNFNGTDYVYISCDHDGAVRVFNYGRQMIACFEPTGEEVGMKGRAQHDADYDMHMNANFMYLSPLICTFFSWRWTAEDEDASADIPYYIKMFEDMSSKGSEKIFEEKMKEPGPVREDLNIDDYFI